MTRRQGLAEMALFAGASILGVIGLGQAFRGHLLWLVVTAVALIVLSKQMGRVQDHWARRRPQGERIRARRPATVGHQARRSHFGTRSSASVRSIGRRDKDRKQVRVPKKESDP